MSSKNPTGDPPNSYWLPNPHPNVPPNWVGAGSYNLNNGAQYTINIDRGEQVLYNKTLDAENYAVLNAKIVACNPKPGDLFILTFPAFLPGESMPMVAEAAKKIADEFQVKVIVLPDALDLDIAPKEEIPTFLDELLDNFGESELAWFQKRVTLRLLEKSMGLQALILLD